MNHPCLWRSVGVTEAWPSSYYLPGTMHIREETMLVFICKCSVLLQTDCRLYAAGNTVQCELHGNQHHTVQCEHSMVTNITQHNMPVGFVTPLLVSCALELHINWVTTRVPHINWGTTRAPPGSFSGQGIGQTNQAKPNSQSNKQST